MIHTYVVNELPQVRISFNNGWTVSVVISGDGSVALARWPTVDETKYDPKRFTDKQREELKALVYLGNQEAGATELLLFLTETEALPAPEGEVK